MQAQEGAVGPTTLRPLYPRERSGTHYKGGWVGLAAGLGDTENFTATEIRLPHRPDHSSSLCQLLQILGTTRYYKDLMRQVSVFIFKMLITFKFFGQSEFINKTLTINLQQQIFMNITLVFTLDDRHFH